MIVIRKSSFYRYFLLIGATSFSLLTIYLVKIEIFAAIGDGNETTSCHFVIVSSAPEKAQDWLEKFALDYDGNDSVIIYRSPSLQVNGTRFVDANFKANYTCRLVRGRRLIATYGSHGDHLAKAKRACRHAVTNLGIDACFVFLPKFVDGLFWQQNAEILRQQRGAGYWLWKPYIIWRLLLIIDSDDVLLYMDADRILISHIEHHICIQETVKQDIVVFPTYNDTLPEYQFTKADAYMVMNVENIPFISTTTQIYACYLLLRKSLHSTRFILEWLTYCQDNRVNTDQPNRIRKNPQNFGNTLHDQSALSLLSKKWNLATWPNPELDWNHPQYSIDQYGVVFRSFNPLPTRGNYTPPTRPIIARH